ncbi:MAG: hypothetical protein Q7O66_05655 [Dehalococcoidia bacterium]|nr:hypothetical protein [Dehalococcoidia bacterium]
MTKSSLSEVNNHGRKRRGPIVLVAMILVLLVIVWASPAEETLGDLVKIVYVHGALIRAAELVFVASGMAGALYLLKKTTLAVRWSWALQRSAFICLLLSFIASLYAMILSWGGINWTEPRFLAVGRILAASAIALTLNYLLPRAKIMAWTSMFMVAVVLFEIATAGLVLHPDNPIGTSPSMATKVYYYGILLCIVAIAVESAHLLLPTKSHHVEPDA